MYYFSLTEPDGIVDPEVLVISSSEIRIVWESPVTPNGNITEYQLFLRYSNGSNVSLINSTQTGSYVVSGLAPFTQYGFYMLVCNGAGCRSSNIVAQTTLESGKFV